MPFSTAPSPSSPLAAADWLPAAAPGSAAAGARGATVHAFLAYRRPLTDAATSLPTASADYTKDNVVTRSARSPASVGVVGGPLPSSVLQQGAPPPNFSQGAAAAAKTVRAPLRGAHTAGASGTKRRARACVPAAGEPGGMPATTTDAETTLSARPVASPVVPGTAAACSTRLSHAALLAETVEGVVAEWLQRIGAAVGSVSVSAAGGRRASMVALASVEEDPGRRRLRGEGNRVGSRSMRWRGSRLSSGVRAPGSGELVAGASCPSPPARRRTPAPPPPPPSAAATAPAVAIPVSPAAMAVSPPPCAARLARALGGGEARATGHCRRRSRRRQPPRQRRRPPPPRAANRHHRCRLLCAEDGGRTPSHT